ncbi:MAG: SDR family NAD(P)-dependent oxidoreductase, partial [Ktedonobacterales bacterium]
MDLGLAGRVAIVTAASKGMGLASAKALVADGASVVICAREPRRLDEAAGEIRAVATQGAQVVAMSLDVSATDAPAKLVGQARDRFARLDVLVANAGGPPPGGFARVG